MLLFQKLATHYGTYLSPGDAKNEAKRGGIWHRHVSMPDLGQQKSPSKHLSSTLPRKFSSSPYEENLNNLTSQRDNS